MKLKTILFTIAVVIFNVLGDLALSYGMKLAGHPAAPLDYIRAIFTPWVAAGVILLILWMLSYMSLLSWADLSFARPVTALSFALAPVMAWATLGENISPARWGGIALITLGVILVGQTAAHGHSRLAGDSNDSGGHSDDPRQFESSLKTPRPELKREIVCS